MSTKMYVEVYTQYDPRLSHYLPLLSLQEPRRTSHHIPTAATAAVALRYHCFALVPIKQIAAF